MTQDTWVVVGLDNGGNKNNATVLDPTASFLVDRMVETASRVQEGPEIAVEALALAFDGILERTGIARARVRAVGLDTPGPASPEGVISSKGSTNFAHSGWGGFDFRGGGEPPLLHFGHRGHRAGRRCDRGGAHHLGGLRDGR